MIWIAALWISLGVAFAAEALLRVIERRSRMGGAVR